MRWYAFANAAPVPPVPHACWVMESVGRECALGAWRGEHTSEASNSVEHDFRLRGGETRPVGEVGSLVGDGRVE